MDHASTSSPRPAHSTAGLAFLDRLDYSVLQQCMHCGMCLPSCPTYLETKKERNSPRGRIALMRAIADGELAVTKAFGEEMYYCLGCLACVTACPAGVNYPQLFENARAEIEHQGVLFHPERQFWRWLTLRQIFAKPRLLHLVGRLLWLYQASGLSRLMRRSGLMRVLPKNLRELEPSTPTVRRDFSADLISENESPADTDSVHYRVGMLTGCVQDLVFSDINRDTVDVLLHHGCAVTTPRLQGCCGSLQAHNGDLTQAKIQARRLMDQFDLAELDAIVSNAAGCGSHLKHFHTLLADDPDYAAKAKRWDELVCDISEWLVRIGIRPVASGDGDVDGKAQKVTYHEACHLCHGQGITKQPRAVLAAVPGLELVELEQATHCCGSAGIYNITQPVQAAKLQAEKVACIAKTGASIVATANPGCHLQIQNGVGEGVEVRHPVSLLAEAYRAERNR